jgi:PAS domain S-box-containing protein
MSGPPSAVSATSTIAEAAKPTVFQSVFAARTAASWNPIRALWPVVVVGSGYYVGCLAGFALRFPSSGISFFWPPTAVLTAALVLTVARSWPALLAGSFVAHAIAHAGDGVPAAASPILFLGNASQALLAAAILRRFLRGSPLFANLRNVVIFLVGACALAPAIASLVPAYAYVQLAWAPDLFQAWRDRAISNSIGTLTLVPSFIALWHVLSERRRTGPRRLLEYGLLLIGVIAVQLATAKIGGLDVLGLSIALYAPAPFLVWATVRFGGPGLSFALVWTTLLAIDAASGGHGSLTGATPADTVIGVQLLIAANAIPMMLVAGLLEQNRSAHRALEEVELQNRAILDAVPDSLYILPRDGASATSPVVPQAAARGARPTALLPPELAERIADTIGTASLESPSVIEFTRAEDDDIRRFEARFVALDDRRALAVVRDITDRWRATNALREVEQRYALATAASGVGVWELDVATQRLQIEGNLRAFLGYSHGDINDQLAAWMTVVHEADREDIESRFASLMSGRLTSIDVEFRAIRKDGATRWVSSKGAVVQTVDGNSSSILGTYADITERKEAARALAEANDAVVRTGRIVAVAEFSASIAHEIKQPLSAMALNAKACLLLLDAAGSFAEIRAALNDVVNESVRATEIINRTQALFTNHPMRRAPMHLNDAVRHMVEMALGRLHRSDIAVELRLDEALPAVLADAVQVHQVLLNLIINAIDAMSDVPQDRRVLRIGTRRGRHVAIVSVRDRGRGFASDEARRVFEPFYTTKATGIGMGLAISRSIVTNHGGRLWGVRNVDRGATFRFTLPLLGANR